MHKLKVLKIGAIGTSTAFPNTEACTFLTNLSNLSILEISMNVITPKYELETFGDTLEHLRCLESLKLGFVGSQCTATASWTFEAFAPCLLVLTRLQDIMCYVLDCRETAAATAAIDKVIVNRPLDLPLGTRRPIESDVSGSVYNVSRSMFATRAVGGVHASSACVRADRRLSVVLNREATLDAMREIKKFVCGLRVPVWMLNMAGYEAQFDQLFDQLNLDTSKVRSRSAAIQHEEEEGCGVQCDAHEKQKTSQIDAAAAAGAAAAAAAATAVPAAAQPAGPSEEHKRVHATSIASPKQTAPNVDATQVQDMPAPHAYVSSPANPSLSREDSYSARLAQQGRVDANSCINGNARESGQESPQATATATHKEPGGDLNTCSVRTEAQCIGGTFSTRLLQSRMLSLTGIAWHRISTNY